MTHEQRIAAAKAYYRHTAIERTELIELRGRMEQVRSLLSTLTGTPSLSKLTKLLSDLRALFEGGEK